MLLKKTYGHSADPASVTEVLVSGDWGIVWASPSDDVVEKALFVQRSATGSVYRGSWSTVDATPRAYLAYARRLHVPSPLAECFAQHMSAEPAI